MPLVSDNDVEKALDWLRDHADEIAEARAHRIYLEEFRKSMKAQIMGEHLDKPVSAQEREAYSDPRYTEFLDGMKEAIRRDEKLRFLARAAETKVDCWRTASANRRIGP